MRVVLSLEEPDVRICARACVFKSVCLCVYNVAILEYEMSVMLWVYLCVTYPTLLLHFARFVSNVVLMLLGCLFVVSFFFRSDFLFQLRKY